MAVGKSVLNIAISTIRKVKDEIGRHTRQWVLDPLARRQREHARQEAEQRQAEIDKEMVFIYERVKRNGGNWTSKWKDRFWELEQESQRIADEFGERESLAVEPEDYDEVILDPTRIHVLEWHIGQSTNKICPRCNMPMILRIPTDQRLNPHPSFFWGCTGFFSSHQCRHTERVTNSDMGALVRKDNEFFAMQRDEIIRKANDKKYKYRIGQDLNDLKLQSFDAYRCPVHRRAMVLKRKKIPIGPLDVWYLKCPSPTPWNSGMGCSQMVKIKSVAQVLAVRELGTGQSLW